MLVTVLLAGCAAHQHAVLELAQPAGPQRQEEGLQLGASSACWMLVDRPEGGLEAIRVVSRDAVPEGQVIDWQPAESLRAMMCSRPTLVPQATDVEYLVGGLPLLIRDESSGRSAVLEQVRGRVRYGLYEGKVDKDEASAIQAAIDDLQARLQCGGRSQCAERP